MDVFRGQTLLGASRRQTAVRAALAVLVVGALVWALPLRRPGELGGHHAAHEPALPAPDPWEKAGVSELKEGQRGPAFRLGVFASGGVGREKRGLDDYRGRLVVLNFWATWCAPCTAEMPTLESLWREYRERGLTVVGISEDRGAPRALLEPYLRGLGLTFPILVDPDLAASRRWRVTGLPATFVIRPDGEVAGLAMGAREWNSPAMRALLESLLPTHGHGR
ncbi:MAG: TlpA family protein disulfide reductase [Candidatus Rokubacteria bacterium]|nr:TlpA family protein disulfide reductase [Candidatus Rokubacteria bacterium]MBI3827051.1 TlpA family protein disulfide reductase [Candidatus Rokubacteria bacterium]